MRAYFNSDSIIIPELFAKTSRTVTEITIKKLYSFPVIVI